MMESILVTQGCTPVMIGVRIETPVASCSVLRGSPLHPGHDRGED